MNKVLVILILTFVSALTVLGQDSYLDKGNSFLNRKDFDGAERVFREGIEAKPNDKILLCQLGLTLIQKGEYENAEKILTKILDEEPNNVAANWYSGIGHFKNAKDRNAIEHFEKVLPSLEKSSGQYYSANWFIGKCYSNLLRTDGLTYSETSRMLECYEEYLRLQPNAKDSQEIRQYVERKRKRRPSDNVDKWIDL